MQFHFQPMTLDHAQQIDGWRYDGIYRFYNLDEDLDDREEFFDQSTWGNSSFAVVDENEELVGFFGFKRENEELVLGLGLHPDHSGKGLGEDFVRAGMGIWEAGLPDPMHSGWTWPPLISERSPFMSALGLPRRKYSIRRPTVEYMSF